MQWKQAGVHGVHGVPVRLLVEEEDSRELEPVWEATPVLETMPSSETATHRAAPNVSDACGYILSLVVW